MADQHTVGPSQPTLVPIGGYGSQTVENIGPDTVYYRTGITVSAAVNDGTLASGASLTITTTTAFLAQSSSAALSVTTATGRLASNVPVWQPNTHYPASFIVQQAGALYSATTDFTSGTTFNATNWALLSNASTPATFTVNWRGAWATATSYAVNDMVASGATDKFNAICTVAHTSAGAYDSSKFTRWTEDRYNVRMFGAVGDGFADDTTAINNAVAASLIGKSNLQRGSTVFFPAGVYKVSSEIVLTGTSESVIGEGPESTVIVPASDFGFGKYAMRVDAIHGRTGIVSGIRFSGPVQTGWANGSSQCLMNGVQIAGGWKLENCTADHFYRGCELLADHCIVKFCTSQTNFYGLYLGYELNAEANHLYSDCQFTSNMWASIGISGSNQLGGTVMSGIHTGFGAYGIYKESQNGPFPSTPTAVAQGTGTGTLTAGTKYYRVTAYYGPTSETCASAEVSVVAAANDSVVVTWPTVTFAQGTPGASNLPGGNNPQPLFYRIYRGTSASGENTYFQVAGNVLTFTDTGAAGTALTPPLGNSAALSGNQLNGVYGESFTHGYLFCESNETVNDNVFISCSGANTFQSSGSLPGLAKRAGIVCGSFSQNLLIGDMSGPLALGTDAGGSCVYAAFGGNQNYWRASQSYFPPTTVPPITTSSATTIPGLIIDDPRGARAVIANLYSGTCNNQDLLGAALSNDRLKQYPAGGTGPVYGVAATTLAAPGPVLMWTRAPVGGEIKVNTSDATLNGNDLWIKPDTVNAGQVVKATGKYDTNVIGYTISGLSAGAVSVVLQLP